MSKERRYASRKFRDFKMTLCISYLANTVICSFWKVQVVLAFEEYDLVYFKSWQEEKNGIFMEFGSGFDNPDLQTFRKTVSGFNLWTRPKHPAPLCRGECVPVRLGVAGASPLAGQHDVGPRLPGRASEHYHHQLYKWVNTFIKFSFNPFLFIATKE